MPEQLDLIAASVQYYSFQLCPHLLWSHEANPTVIHEDHSHHGHAERTCYKVGLDGRSGQPASALPCPAGRSGPWSRRTGAPMASATGRDRTPRSALGPCRNGPLSASAVTNGRERFGETAGRRPSSSGSCDDAGGRFGLWSRGSAASPRCGGWRGNDAAAPSGRPARRAESPPRLRCASDSRRRRARSQCRAPDR
jgi:hypothetical protein